jgi:lipoic acid synthetase
MSMTERRLPVWFKVPAPGGPNYRRLAALMREKRLHTICEEAGCPNIGECWEYGTATFLILGDVCTRACLYCDVTSGRPGPVDPFEPFRVAAAIKTMGLRHAVITSVNRDDLLDGGAAVFAEVVRQIRKTAPLCTVELLVPDFMGSPESLKTVLDEKPDVLNHNIESVERVFPIVRAKGRYRRSIELLAAVKDISPSMTTKSGVILGMGEERGEVVETLWDLREAGVDIVTLGQYLRPSPKHIAVSRFLSPEEFASLKQEALGMGFRHVESGPLVRSSYHAHEHATATR